MSKIIINSIIEWIAENDNTLMERVLWVEHSGESIIVISLDDLKALPFFRMKAEIEKGMSEGIAILRPIDPYSILASPAPNFLAKHREERDRAWEIIKVLAMDVPFIYYENYRGPAVRKIAKEKTCSVSTIYKHLRNFWIRGMIRNALLPMYQKCGAPGKLRRVKFEHESNKPIKRGRPSLQARSFPEMAGVNVDEEIRKVFSVAIRTLYNTRKCRTLTSTYQKMKEDFFNIGHHANGAKILPPAHTLPTYDQFDYWYRKEKDLVKSIKSREGQRKYELTCRPLLGNSTSLAFGPGAIYQIDATIGDVYLVWSLDRNWLIGRPVIYFCIDVFSRLITGIHVGLEGPNWIMAMMALSNAMTDKVSFCAKYDIAITCEAWPCCYLPCQYTADRGELLCDNSDGLVSSLDITVANCPPYRGDFKGIVERQFGRVNQKTVKWLPGTVRKREPGERNCALDAKLDLKEFMQILIYDVLEYNLSHRIDTKRYPMGKDMIRDGVEPIPIELWNWGIVNRSGHLRQKSPQAVMLALMPKITGKVTEQGIRANGMFYGCQRALDEQWYQRARRKGNWDIQVCHDPRNIDTINVILADGTAEPCSRLVDKCDSNERFNDCYLEDVQEYYGVENLKSQLYRSTAQQSTADFNTFKQQIIDNAIKSTKEANPKNISNSQRLQNIKKNRTAARDHRREEEKWDLRPKGDVSGPGKLLPFAGGNEFPVIIPSSDRYLGEIDKAEMDEEDQ
ncbi:MAG: Mu transposase C-terminal domain-containing protein [Geobacteraceae bacterium]|nr:Mu transposase C-terminal domain-containing protein [Geobacteraceae bacterium]